MENNNIEIQKQELAKLSGEYSLRGSPFASFPILRINGQTGKFEMITYNPNEERSEREELEQTEIQGIMLKHRRSLFQFVKDYDGKKKRLFTNEHDSYKDRVVLFESIEGKRPRMIDEGISTEIKQKYPSKPIVLSTTTETGRKEGEALYSKSTLSPAPSNVIRSASQLIFPTKSPLLLFLSLIHI